jgi:arylsulfatase A-like enzyme
VVGDPLDEASGRGGGGAARAALLLALAAALAGCGGAPRPNVLLVSIDTLRADAVGAYGSPFPTPVLDALAASGALFENAIAPAPATAPSHATLLTGIDVPRHGVGQNGTPLPAELRTLPAAFGAAGYATGGFVSSFVLDPRFGWSRGFETYDATFPRRGQTFRQRVGFATRHEFDGYDRRAPHTTGPALAWLASAAEPFFLFVHYFDPHAPYDAPEELLRQVPPGEARRLAQLWLPEAHRELPRLTLDDLTRVLRHYHAEVLGVDRAVGALLAALDERGLEGRTLVVVTADHGEGLGEHGSLDHAHQLYEAQVRVPLILRWPGQLAAGLRLATPVGLVDVAPTLAELAGVELGDVDGRSLAGALRAGVEPEPRPLLGRRRRYERPIGGHRGQKFFVREARWKYIRASDDPDELYDLREDPGERRNLYAADSREAARLGAILERHLAAHPEPAAPPLGDEERRGLEALGYAEPESSAPGPAPAGSAVPE